MEIIDPNIHYPLAVGTPQERSIPLKSESTLGKEYDQTFAVLVQLYDAGTRHPAGAGQCAMIRAIWILWCYASHDITAARKLADERHEQSIAASDKLHSELESLRAEVAELRGRVDYVEDEVSAGDT